MVKAISRVIVMILLFHGGIVCADEIPSCLDVNKYRHGSAPACAPPSMNEREAADAIKRLKLERVEFNWYLFAPEKWWKKTPINARWKILIRAVSSIQSVGGGKANIYLAVSPQDETEKRFFVRNGVPLDKIKAVAIYRSRKNFFSPAGKSFPSNHHKVAYSLVVY